MTIFPTQNEALLVANAVTDDISCKEYEANLVWSCVQNLQINKLYYLFFAKLKNNQFNKNTSLTT